MAIYRLEAKIISRGNGHSAVAAAAYRTGTKIRDERADKHLLDMDEDALALAFSEADLPAAHPVHPKALLRAMRWAQASPRENRKRSAGAERCPDIFKWVASVEEVEMTDHDKVIAKLVPAGAPPPDFVSRAKGLWGENPPGKPLGAIVAGARGGEG